jgi:pyruvate/2-oxoglutarate dehydrogenase complex dihydrolipoamide acyltransferase (E2) component
MTTVVVLPETAWEGVDGNVQGLVDAWLVAEGAVVEAGQPLVRVVLVKSNLEVEATASGRLEKILVPAGENFGRGQALGRIAT